MTQEPKQELPPAIQQQLGLLQLRISDMMHELNNAIKAFADGYVTLQKENAELKAKPKEAQKTR
jgi:hypothetical protein